MNAAAVNRILAAKGMRAVGDGYVSVLLPVYLLQLATGFMNLALPSSVARMAVDIRFFQRQGVPPATAVTASLIDSFIGNVIQVVLLCMLLLFS